MTTATETPAPVTATSLPSAQAIDASAVACRDAAPGAAPLPGRPWQLHVFLLLFSGVVVALAATMNVQGSKQVHLPGISFPVPELCYFRRGTGFDCPGCGLTRSFISLAHGQLALAWNYNPAGVLFFPVVVFQIPYRLGQLIRLRQGLACWDLCWLTPSVFISLFVVMVVQWGAKILGFW